MKKPKSLLEAYDLTISTANKLKEIGVKVKITKHTPSNEDKVNKKTLPIEKWCHIGLKAKTGAQWDAIMKAGADLVDLGIWFDTGAGFGQRDWELDWSFSLAK